MKYALVAALVLFAALPARAATGADALGRLEGSWTATATALATPYSKAGSTRADTTCALVVVARVPDLPAGGYQRRTDFARRSRIHLRLRRREISFLCGPRQRRLRRRHRGRRDDHHVHQHVHRRREERHGAHDQRLGRSRSLPLLDGIHHRRNALGEDADRHRAAREELEAEPEAR